MSRSSYGSSPRDMRASWSWALLLVACSSDIVQIGPDDAGTRDGGTAAIDAHVRDAGSVDAGFRDGGVRTFSCPDRIEPLARHALTDVAPSIPARVAINGSRVLAAYGRLTQTGTAVGYLALEGDTLLQDDLLPLDGALIDGPFVSPVRNFGFLAVTRTDDADGAHGRTDVWIGDEAPVRRSFEWNDRFRMDDAVSQGDGIVITGTSSTGELLFHNVDVSGNAVGWGRRETMEEPPVDRALYANRGTGRWRFELIDDLFMPARKSVLIVPIAANGRLDGFAPSPVCGVHYDFHAAAIDRERTLLLTDCTTYGLLNHFSFAVGGGTLTRRLDGRVATGSRVSFDGATAYVLRWSLDRDAPALRAFSATLDDDYGTRDVPIEAEGPPAKMDVAAVNLPAPLVAVIATWGGDSPGGELIVFEGCGLR